MKARLVIVVLFLILCAAVLPAAPVIEADPACDSMPVGLIGHAQSILGDALGIDVQGDFAYVADWGGRLQVFDISDPCHPLRLGSAPTPGNEFGDLTIDGSYAYVANDGHGLSKYDISDPNAPAYVSSRLDGRYAHDVFYDGGQYAFVGQIYSAGRELAIYDIGSYPSAAPIFYSPSFSGHRDIYSVDVAGDRAYVCASSGNGDGHFQILDISSLPLNPVFISELFMPLSQYGGGCGVRVQGSHAFLTTHHHSSHDGGLIVVNITNENVPYIEGTVFVPDAGIVPWKPAGLDIYGDNVYVMAQNGLYDFDVSDPENPTQVNQFPYPADFGRISGGQVVIRDDLAFAAVYRYWPPSGEDHGGLAIYRIRALPNIEHISAPVDPVSIYGQPVNVGVEFSGPPYADVTWDWGDLESDTQSAAASPAAASHTYAEAGTYSVKLTVEYDGSSDSEIYEYIVIYDPDGGFVTGGGWINSPAGAFVSDPDLTGKANFGFVSKYKRGAAAPTGNTQFNFKAGGLVFHSTHYDWLVINQNGTNAQYKGSGTINGEGGFNFMLTAMDLGSDGDDTLRIKIWDDNEGEEIVYDNGPGQALGGGNIVMHVKKK